MKAVQYLHFRKDDGGNVVGKSGGMPTIRPSEKPWPPEDDDLLAFVLELRVDGRLLVVPGASFIQLYQPIDAGDDPLPIAIVIRSEKAGEGFAVNPHPDVMSWVITAEDGAEPDVLPPASLSPEYRQFYRSKLGGNDPWKEDAGRIFLGQISEMPGGFNFGGTMCSLYLENEGSVTAELH